MKNAERHSNNTCTNINPRMVQAHCLKRLKSSFTYALNRNVLIEMKKKYIYLATFFKIPFSRILVDVTETIRIWLGSLYTSML